jgi:hypothetical protein
MQTSNASMTENLFDRSACFLAISMPGLKNKVSGKIFASSFINILASGTSPAEATCSRMGLRPAPLTLLCNSQKTRSLRQPLPVPACAQAVKEKKREY